MGIIFKLLAFTSLAFLLSCSYRTYFVPDPKILHEFDNCYSSDKIKVRIMLFAPYKFETKNLKRRDARILKGYAGNNVDSSALLFFAESHEPVTQKHFFFSRNFVQSSWKGFTKRMINDSTSYYYRIETIKRTKLYEAIIPFNDRSIVILSYPVANMQKWYIQDTDFIVQTIFVGNQYKPCTPENAFSVVNDAFMSNDSGNYLLPLSRLAKLKSNYQGEIERNKYYQAICNFYSLSDRMDSVDYYWSKLKGSMNAKDPDLIGKLVPAYPAIVERTKNSRVVILNEAHTQPKHRYFAGILLKELYSQGFRYLALEALSKDDSLNVRKFPLLSSGFYVREPTMANLIRYALELGYTLISYDVDTVDTSNREFMQAQNIFDKTIKGRAESKVLVLAGHGHIDESSTEQHKMMARHFYEISGINPLTINQTDIENQFGSIGNNGEVLLAEKMTKPIMQNDIYTINNIAILNEDNCFRSRESQSIHLTIPKKLLPEGRQYIVLVYNNEYSTTRNPVPVQVRYLIDAMADLKLCRGKYTALLKDQLGETLWKRELSVD